MLSLQLWVEVTVFPLFPVLSLDMEYKSTTQTNMASISCKSIFSILFLFVLLMSYSLAVKEDKDSDKNSEMNDFAEFEREDDEEVDDSYEDEIENQPAERSNKVDEFDDDEVDVETGTFYFETIL